MRAERRWWHNNEVAVLLLQIVAADNWQTTLWKYKLPEQKICIRGSQFPWNHNTPWFFENNYEKIFGREFFGGAFNWNIILCIHLTDSITYMLYLNNQQPSSMMADKRDRHLPNFRADRSKHVEFCPKLALWTTGLQVTLGKREGWTKKSFVINIKRKKHFWSIAWGNKVKFISNKRITSNIWIEVSDPNVWSILNNYYNISITAVNSKYIILFTINMYSIQIYVIQ